ncbi:hypothetical protein [Nocardioides hwasunensis]|uniref:Uncharacterized protein n=1 Tax=Nocardioides hwasunensis TaxID=397258 RepID=A0ABR8MKT6_9ACTN|nr:hypothetical protein [Nocardioides hwasunensis]MBD3916607.1 hypothetical protein [Nocardioides hwasunensis]
MKREHDHEVLDLTGRIQSLDQFTGSLFVRAQPDADVIPIHEAPAALVPVPRRSRVYLRGGEGKGFFAELTVTAPRPRASTD